MMKCFDRMRVEALISLVAQITNSIADCTLLCVSKSPI